MIYAYAICEPAVAEPPPRGVGLKGAQLRALQSAGVGAVYSRHRSRLGRPETELVLKHERVIEQIMARGPVLPLRFGTQLDGEEQLAAALAERREELLGALDRVRGHVELGLRVIPHSAAQADPDARSASGRDYLLARVEQHEQARALERELHAPLARLATDSVVRPRPTPPAILVAAYLVDADGVDDFRRRASELADRHRNAQVLITGPWPPYSFAAQEDR